MSFRQTLRQVLVKQKHTHVTSTCVTVSYIPDRLKADRSQHGERELGEGESQQRVPVYKSLDSQSSTKHLKPRVVAGRSALAQQVRGWCRARRSRERGSQLSGLCGVPFIVLLHPISVSFASPSVLTSLCPGDVEFSLPVSPAFSLLGRSYSEH